MRLDKRTTGFAATVAASIAVSLAAIALAQGDGAPQGLPGSASPAASPPLSERPVSRVGPDVAAKVAVLRRPRTSEDVLPADVAKYVEWAPLRGANGRLSRKAFSKDGQVAYVLPGDGVACLVLTGRGGGAAGPSCRSPEQLSSESGGPAVLGLECTDGTEGDLPTCEGRRLFGLVADDVEKVTVPFEGGGSVSAPVEGNAYLIDVPGQPREIRLDSGSGVIKQRIP